jgi:succinate dehydrogenase/fumarate reductase flavoprotein subunit
MTRNPGKLVVVGHGAAGLAAALSASEQAQSRGFPVDITLLEKSREDESGGNTRWSPSNMRLDAPDRIDPGFEDDMVRASNGLADRSYFRTLAENAVPTVRWLQSYGLAAADTLKPSKSNWTRAIARPPFLAFPLVGAVAYTFGGLATNERAEVLSKQGPMPGLFAAGETTGHFYGTAPNAVAVLRALVFGKIAGREAVGFLQTG